MPTLLQIIILLLVITIGFFVSKGLGIKNKIEILGLSILLGTAISTYGLFVSYYYLDATISKILAFKALGALLLLSLLFCSSLRRPMLLSLKNVVKYFDSFSLRKHNKLYIGIALLIGITVLITLISNYFWPITDWDSLVLYDFRAVVISKTGSFDDGIRRGYFLQYPPFTSLLHSMSYLVGFTRAKIWYSLLFFGLLLTFYSLIRKESSKFQALAGTLMLSLSPLILSHSQMAYTNFPYSIYISLGYLYITSWIKTKNWSYLIVGSLLTAFSTWVRLSEPFWFFSVLLIIFGLIIHRQHFFQAFLSFFTIYFLKNPWLSFVAEKQSLTSNSLPQLLPIGGSGLNLVLISSMIPEVAVFILKNVLPIFFIYLIPLSIVLFILYKRKNWLKLLESLIFFTPLGMICLGTLIFSTTFPEWKSIPDSAARMSMFLIPIMIYLIASGDVWQIRREKK